MKKELKKLTKRQKLLLEFIIDYYNKKGYPPTLREMADFMGIKSLNGIISHLNALEKKGYIEKKNKLSRSISINKNLLKESSIPLVGKVVAGIPLESFEGIEKFLDINKKIFGSYENIFALKVIGDSMKDAGILKDDIVFVVPSIIPNNGDIVVARVNGETTVKYFYKNKNIIKLVPANKDYATIYIENNKDNCQIIGKVVGVLRVY